MKRVFIWCLAHVGQLIGAAALAVGFWYFLT